jgi:hypothetical protein
MKYKAAILTLSLTSFFAPMAWAQDALKDAVDNPNSPLAGVTANRAHTEKSADEIARDLANPNSPLASLNGKLQYRTFDGNLPGASNQHSMTFLFQPVFPFDLGETSSGAAQTLFVRPEIPYFFNQPTFNAGTGVFEDVAGMGDIVSDFAYGQTTKNGFLWAIGGVITLPTATDSRLGSGKWSLGPEILLGKFEKWGVYGIFPSHQWDVAGWGDRSVNATSIQTFLAFLPGDGWSISSQPIMDYDWQASQWTIPVNLTVSKTLKAGKTPLKVSLEADYYVEQSDVFGPEWMIGLKITPVVENFIQSWITGK